MVRARRIDNGLSMTLMSTPTPLAVGEVEWSVVVQEASTHAFLPASVEFEAWPGNQASKALKVAGAASGPMMSARMRLDRAGKWTVRAIVAANNRTSIVTADVDVDAEVVQWRSLLGWILIPLAPIGAFALHQWLSERERRRRHGRFGPRHDDG